jgi:hypothetical protein
MFVPPGNNRPVIGFVNAALPTLANFIAGIRDTQVSPEDLARLKELRSQRAILAPNHPTGNDPVVILWLSRMLGEPFNYLCAREVLEGPKGWLLNQLGAYSVIRGVPDRESLRYTRRLLAERDRKVVIFPEGEIYEHNDSLLAFQSGVVQLGFWAMDDLKKGGKPPVLPIVPIAIKYRCCESPRPAIENSLRDLEHALDLEPAPKLSAYQRLRRAGDRVLASLERDAGLPAREGEELPPRIREVRQRMLDRVAQAIGDTVDADQPPADQIHLLFHHLKSWVGLLPDDPSDYDERRYRHKMEIAAPLFNDLHRLQNFIAITGDYVAAEATAERFLDVLGRLEAEVFGEVRHRVPREALVKIAPPIRLEARYEEYRASKREVVAQVTREMEDAIRGMLRELSKEATPIALEA